jgi:hypothetical protein
VGGARDRRKVNPDRSGVVAGGIFFFLVGNRYGKFGSDARDSSHEATSR